MAHHEAIEAINAAATEVLTRLDSESATVVEMSRRIAQERGLNEHLIFSRCLYFCDTGGMERAERTFGC
jgi:uncharacterized membrane protein YjjP (DUF1212 family)